MDQRRFTNEEVSEILRRAVDDRSGELPECGQGLTLSDLKSIGGEAGIDPARIGQAARALTQASAVPTRPLIGIPTSLRVERRVRGALDSARVAAILSTIRRTMGVAGEVSEVGGLWEWRAAGNVDRLVTLAPSKGAITIEVTVNLRQAIVSTAAPGGLIATVLAFIGAMNSGTGDIDGIILSVMLVPAFYVLMRAYFHWMTRSEAAKVAEVVDEIADLVARGEKSSKEGEG